MIDVDHFREQDETRARLTELPSLADDLEHARTGVRRGRDETRRAAKNLATRTPVNLDVVRLQDRRPLPFDITAVDPDRAGLQPYLHGWARYFAADLIDADRWAEPEPWDETVFGACGYLLRNLDAIGRLSDWPAFAHGVNRLHGATAAVTRQLRAPTKNEAHAEAVPCPRCEIGRLQAKGASWRCNACGHDVKIQAVTLAQAAAAVKRSHRTMRRWVSSGKVASVTGPNGVRRVDLASVRAHAARLALAGE